MPETKATPRLITNVQYRTWLAALKPGDKVGVFARGVGFIYETEVTKITPSGRIVCHRETFKSDGFIYGATAPCYRDRCLRPLP